MSRRPQVTTEYTAIKIVNSKNSAVILDGARFTGVGPNTNCIKMENSKDVKIFANDVKVTSGNSFPDTGQPSQPREEAKYNVEVDIHGEKLDMKFPPLTYFPAVKAEIRRKCQNTQLGDFDLLNLRNGKTYGKDHGRVHQLGYERLIKVKVVPK